MKFAITQLAARMNSFNDVSKLCFTASSVFAMLGTGGWLASYLNPSASRFSVFLLISGFYLTLGLIGQWKANRASAGRPEHTINAFQSQRDQIINQRRDRAA